MSQPPTPAISVCIANYNGEGMLVDCLDSVLAQQCDAPVEIIVHDDASSDGSIDLLKRRYPDVTLIISETNVGFCVSNNRMVDAASGQFVLLLNNDAALLPGALSAMLAEAQLLGAPAILSLPQYDWESGALVDRGCLLDPFCNPIPNLDASRPDVAYVIGACLWCPRDTWHGLGGLPEWMESIGEDLYLCGIARLRGIPVRALPRSGYRHRQGATFGGNRASGAGLHTSVKRRRLSERNKTRALFILVPGFAMWLLLATHLLALAVEGCVLSLVRGDRNLWKSIYLPAIATPFREHGDLSRTRRGVQASRTATVLHWFATVRWQLRKVALLLRHGFPKVA